MTSTETTPFVAILGTVSYMAGATFATATFGETLLLDERQADRLLDLGAVRPWHPGDPDPVEPGVRLGLPPAPPVRADEAPAVSPAPTSDAEQKLRALYGDPRDDEQLQEGLAEFYARRQREAEEDAASTRRLQPWTSEHAELKAELLRSWEAERRVQQREADGRDRRAAAVRAQQQQAVEAELQSMTTMEAR
ncbi:MAG: hypothetical protein H0U48_07000 [Euzebyaceae bacterium]|jgi:hypothetical protein|nr:hypothetical protein [Euzebyaceae bacterium]